MAESYVQALTWYMQPNNAEIAANASKLKTYVENGMTLIQYIGWRKDRTVYHTYMKLGVI